MGVRVKQKGNFSQVTKYFKKVSNSTRDIDFDKYGREGVAALSAATPKETGLTSNSWSYEITRKPGSVTISFHNTNIQNGVPIAIILQYGHGTRNGGWVEGRDYINPALQPVFDRLANEGWREVTKL